MILYIIIKNEGLTLKKKPILIGIKKSVCVCNGQQTLGPSRFETCHDFFCSY